ncbi:MAG: D-cysteine desulfhydrase family protein [Clostridia bacterium]|nr:D-cysteine desulfhydrase family protein [Clostridia bacterium]
MTYTKTEAEKLIAKIPRTQLGFFPTPLHRLDRLSEELGVNLWIKRDDFTGSNLFGGNKTRKLEFLMGHAKELGAEYVITYGATQSNHVMQTVWSAAKNGIKPIAYLAAMVTPDMDDLKGNMLLDKIYGAELQVIYPEEGESFEDAERRSFVVGAEHADRLNSEGHVCYDIPMGGANEHGSLGYVNAMVELQGQLEQLAAEGTEFNPQYLYHATGSGGTMGGIVAGKKLLGMDMEIHSMLTIPMEDTGDYIENGMNLANGALGLIGVEALAETDDFIVDASHAGEAYEVPSDEGSEAIRMLARKEGILVDPVYTGKAFAGLIADIREGRIEQGADVLFLHTGGTTVFFAEKEILGDIF